MPDTIQDVSLFNREGSSDKVYQVQLYAQGDGFRVIAHNGRRGKSLTAREKTKAPVPLESAQKIFDDLVASKKKGGYTESESGIPYSSAEFQGRKTDFRPQLLTVVAEPADDSDDAVWLAQEKFDGDRRGVIALDGKLSFANKKGLETSVAKNIEDALTKLAACETGAAVEAGSFQLDAEDMGTWLAVFDVIAHPAMGASTTFRGRASILEDLRTWTIKNGLTETIHIEIPMPMAEFRETRLPELVARGAEGYVKRKAESVYSAGRPASGGDAMKVPFVESCSVRCDGQNGEKRSVSMSMLDEAGVWTKVGNVTIPGNAPIPVEGAVIEVRYLNANPGGSIYQPVYKGERNDVDLDECLMAQLKYKVEQEAPGLSGPDM